MFAVSCSAPPVKEAIKKTAEDTSVSSLEKFFKRSEGDSIRAGQVIEKHNIIQQLTHLRLMDTGGKKYYLLERENITEMINSVTEGIYLDYVLINKHGDIIYTRKNDSLFGTNVNEGYEETPLKKCFTMRRGVYFEDVALITPASTTYSLYVSSPVYVQQNFHGILVLQIDISKISEILEKNTDVVNSKGIIKIADDYSRINSRVHETISLNLNDVMRDGKMSMETPTEEIDLKSFNFNSISWILVKKKTQTLTSYNR
jgi:energy-converting hydrogenase A subunit M